MDENFVIKICRIIANVVFAVALAFTISYILFGQVLQQGFSMAPYINDGNIVLVNRLYRNLFTLNKQDVIAFYNNGQESIKRIYGLPGETITISNGNFYIDDIQIESEDLKNSVSHRFAALTKILNYLKQTQGA